MKPTRLVLTREEFAAAATSYHMTLRPRQVRRVLQKQGQRLKLTICRHDEERTPWDCGCGFGSCSACCFDTRCSKCGTLFDSRHERPAIIGMGVKP